MKIQKVCGRRFKNMRCIRSGKEMRNILSGLVITAQKNQKNLVGKFMDNYEFEEFMKILKWEIQKYTVNQEMNRKEIDSKDIVDLVIKCENKAIKKIL